LIHPLQKYYATGEINIRVQETKTVFAALEEHYKDARKDHLDGLSIDCGSWWFNLRASNTEPLVRLNLEANDAPTREAKKKELLETIGKADPSLKVEN
jgi:phosphomannomutase